MLTATQCRGVLGDPALEKDMVLFDVPTDLQIGVIPKRIYCNKRMIEPLAAAFAALIKTGEVKNLKTWDGCFNIRKSKGGHSASLHSWGLAIDVNAAWNGYGKPPQMRLPFVRCFTNNGFDWGGVWAKPDGMHFQLKSL